MNLLRRLLDNAEALSADPASEMLAAARLQLLAEVEVADLATLTAEVGSELHRLDARLKATADPDPAPPLPGEAPLGSARRAQEHRRCVAWPVEHQREHSELQARRALLRAVMADLRPMLDRRRDERDQELRQRAQKHAQARAQEARVNRARFGRSLR